jgi:plastocyanin
MECTVRSSTESPETQFSLSRRAALTILVGAGATAAFSRAIVLGHDEDDDDNSGRGSDDDSGSGSDDEGKVAPLGTVPPGSAEVRIVDDDANGFQPGTITIARGDTVTFVNLDDDAHTATGAGFDTGIFQPGQLVTVTFDEAGAFPYACQIHPVMTGVIEVSDGGAAVAASPDASPIASPVAATPGASGEMTTVTIVDFSFDPQEITITAGSTVTWRNDDAVPHTATADDQSFDTGMLNAGDEASHTFDEPGEYPYFCAFHPSMTGVVIVT